MPYRTNLDLPDGVRHALPDHAQDIYRAAFNNAWDAHAGEPGFDEGRLHRIAWSAVKRKYHKEGDEWVPNEWA